MIELVSPGHGIRDGRRPDRVGARKTLRPGTVIIDADLRSLTFPAHSHDHYVVGLVTGGEQISYYDRHQVRASCGDALLVNPGVMHDGAPSGWSGRRYSMVNVEIQTFTKLIEQVTGTQELREFAFAKHERAEISRALARWICALAGDDIGFEQETATLAFGAMARQLNLTGLDLGVAVERDLAAIVRDWIDRQFQEQHEFEELASSTGASRFQIIRAFKRRFGLTPEAYRRQCRVNLAQRLLSHRSSLADVAIEAGFADQSHLTREFKRLTGLTPGALRAAMV